MTEKKPDPQRVVLFDYDPAWKIAFENEENILKSLMKEDIANIDHIGSTSIPGLKAKPVIDVLIQLKNGKSLQDSYAAVLEDSGYIENVFNDQKNRRLFTKGNGQYRTHNIHVTTYNSDFAAEMITCRDKMRADPQIVKEYAELKEALARDYPNDSRAYYKAKQAFLDRVTYG